MSPLNIKAFFKFCPVKVVRQVVDTMEKVVRIKVVPDRRYKPRCYKCGSAAEGVHSWRERTVRDLNVFDAKTFVRVEYRIVRCSNCGCVVEDNGLLYPHLRVTKRLANYIVELCQFMSLKEVAEHFGLDWKTVKEIHKRHLLDKFSGEDIGNLRFLAVDEISVKKRHRYLTVVIDWETGRVVWIGEGRRYETLKEFFDSLTEEQRESIEAIAMDMWDPYIKAVRECCPGARIVFDQFHVVQAFNKVIDKVRNDEYRKADKEGRKVLKGSKYLLLKNKDNLKEEEVPRLREILEANKGDCPPNCVNC